MDPCEQCDFEYREDLAEEAAVAIVTAAADLCDVLHGASGGAVRARREDDTWSALEYACHVRDVLLVQRERVLQGLREDNPTFAPMGRDERVDHDGYAEQHPADVARQLEDAAGLFANVLDRLDEAAWERTVTYNFPVPASRSLRWVAVHTVHEVQHHLGDARRQLT